MSKDPGDKGLGWAWEVLMSLPGWEKEPQVNTEVELVREASRRALGKGSKDELKVCCLGDAGRDKISHPEEALPQH